MLCFITDEVLREHVKLSVICTSRNMPLRMWLTISAVTTMTELLNSVSFLIAFSLVVLHLIFISTDIGEKLNIIICWNTVTRLCTEISHFGKLNTGIDESSGDVFIFLQMRSWFQRFFPQT